MKREHDCYNNRQNELFEIIKKNPKLGGILQGFTEKKSILYSDFITINNKMPLIKLCKCFVDELQKTEGNRERKILDAGSGGGSNTVMLAEHIPYAKIVGIELSEKLVSVAKETNYRDNIEYIVGDVTDPNIMEKYDVIFSSNVLEHVNNPGNMIIALSRLLKKNGVMVHSCPTFWYSFIWDFPRLVTSYIFCRYIGKHIGREYELIDNRFMGGEIELFHGVYHGEIKKAVEFSDLKIIQYRIIMFQPDRGITKRFPEFIFKEILRMYELLGVLFYIKLRRFLQFHVFIIANRDAEINENAYLQCDVTYPKKERITAFLLSPILLPFSFLLLLVSWMMSIVGIVFRFYRLLGKLLSRKRNNSVSVR